MTVRSQAGWKTASKLLLERQLIFLGKVLRTSSDSVLRKVCFIPDTLQPSTSRYVRRVGRPRKEWMSSVLPEAYRVAGGGHRLQAAVQDELQWKRNVRALA